MKTYKKFITENFFNGYKHHVEVQGQGHGSRVKHVFTHKNYQVIISGDNPNGPLFDPSNSRLSLDIRHTPTGNILLSNTYKTYPSKNEGIPKWHNYYRGSHFENSGYTEKEAHKIVKFAINHVNKHFNYGEFSQNPKDHMDYEEYKRELNEIVRKSERRRDDPDGPHVPGPLQGAGENLTRAGWHPAEVHYSDEDWKRPRMRNVSSWLFPQAKNNKIVVDHDSSEWEHVDTKKGGNGHVASGRDLASLKRHLTNWIKIRKS